MEAILANTSHLLASRKTSYFHVSKSTPLDTAQATDCGGLFSFTCRRAGETPFETASCSSFIMRATLAREMWKALAIWPRLRPFVRSRMTALRSMSSGRRPMWRPSRRARRIPALTRSTMRLRSSSAMAPCTTITQVMLKFSELGFGGRGLLRCPALLRQLREPLLRSGTHRLAAGFLCRSLRCLRSWFRGRLHRRPAFPRSFRNFLATSRTQATLWRRVVVTGEKLLAVAGVPFRASNAAIAFTMRACSARRSTRT
jgi:hypothetical protein